MQKGVIQHHKGAKKVHRLTRFFGNAHKLGMKPFRESSIFLRWGVYHFYGTSITLSKPPKNIGIGQTHPLCGNARILKNRQLPIVTKDFQVTLAWHSMVWIAAKI